MRVVQRGYFCANLLLNVKMQEYHSARKNQEKRDIIQQRTDT